MRLLIIGGTVFLGRAITQAARTRGHEVTLFHRGTPVPEPPPPDVEQVQGDRTSDLDRLDGRHWDAVIDTCGYVPRVVAASARRLSDRAAHYTFVSSISAYADAGAPRIDEDAPTARLPEDEPESEDVGAHYGALKAACERAVASALPERALIVRPGLISGPFDPTNRFTYWVTRLASPGRVLVPDAADQPVQLIDVRDLAEWMVAMAERRATGVYNATGPEHRLTFGAMLEQIAAGVHSDPALAPVAEERLAAAGIEPWVELPLWLDLPRHPDLAGFLDADVSRAVAAGLTFRPLAQTAADTLAWAQGHRDMPTLTTGAGVTPAGLSPEREAEVLAQVG